MDCLFISVSIGLQSRKFCVLNKEIIVCNAGFEFKYESECRYYCDMLLPMTIDAGATTLASTVNFDGIGIESFQISGIEFNFLDVLSQTTIPAMSIKIKREIKYESVPSVSQPQPQAQSVHMAQHPVNKPFSFDSTDAESGEFDGLENIFDALSNMDLIVI